MNKRIALMFDVRKRVLIGASDENEEGFMVVHVPEDHSIVVTCDGQFSWTCVPTSSDSGEAK